MLVKSLAIVLFVQKYADNASLLHLYTQAYGKMVFMVYGKKFRNICNYLAIVEITFQYAQNRTIQTLKSIQLAYAPKEITTSPTKQCIAMFMAEILLRTLKHPMDDNQLFTYLQRTVMELDISATPQNAHLFFMVDLIRFLGFAIDVENAENDLIKVLYQGPLSRRQRQQALLFLCNYYKKHIPEFQQPQSLEVLTTIFD